MSQPSAQGRNHPKRMSGLLEIRPRREPQHRIGKLFFHLLRSEAIATATWIVDVVLAVVRTFQYHEVRSPDPDDRGNLDPLQLVKATDSAAGL